MSFLVVLVVSVALDNQPPFLNSAFAKRGACKRFLRKLGHRTYQLHSSGPISRDTAILSLRYPLSRDTFSAIPALPQQGAIPPLPWVPCFTQAHLCDTPFCNISRDTCAIPPGKQARNNFAILSLKVSRDMKSIAAGPLRFQLHTRDMEHL